MTDAERTVRTLAEYRDAVGDAVQTIDLEAVAFAANRILVTLMGGGKVYILGDGHNAFTAARFSRELKDLTGWNRSHLHGMTVSAMDNIELFEVYIREQGRSGAFRALMDGFLTADDLVIGIGGSGLEEGIANGLAFAKEIGAYTILLDNPEWKSARLWSDFTVVPGARSFRSGIWAQKYSDDINSEVVTCITLAIEQDLNDLKIQAGL